MNAPCPVFGSVNGRFRCIFIGGNIMERDSFVLYTRLYELVKDLSLEQKGILFDAIHYFAKGMYYPISDAATEMAFRFYRNQMEMDFEKWEQVRQKRIEAGKQGGRPRKDENQTKAKKANGFSENQTKAKKGVNVNVNDNVNVNVNDNENVSIEATTLPIRTREKFTKPTIEEITLYVAEKGYTFNPQAFFDYYEANGWRVGKNPMKKWKAACANWQRMEQERKQDTRHGNNNEHPTNSELVRNTYDIITELRQLDEQGVPTFRDF